jgi:hypothetical protein
MVAGEGVFTNPVGVRLRRDPPQLMGTQALRIYNLPPQTIRKMGQEQRAHHPHRRHTGMGSAGIQEPEIRQTNWIPARTTPE